MTIEWNKVTWYSKLAALGVLLITIILGVYLWNEYQTIQQLKNAPAFNIQQNPSTSSGQAINTQQSSIDTSGWQTYRNDEYGFEVRLPEYYDSLEQEDRGLALLSLKALPTSNAPTQDDIRVNVFNLYSYLFQSAITDERIRFDEKTGHPYRESSYSAEKSELTPEYVKNGNSVYRFGSGDAGSIVQHFLIPRVEKGIVVELSFALNPLTRGAPQEEILSTFRFTE